MDARDLQIVNSICKKSILFKTLLIVLLIFTLACPILYISGHYLGSGEVDSYRIINSPLKSPYIYNLGIAAYSLCLFVWLLLSIIVYIKSKELSPAIKFFLLSILYVIAMSWTMQTIFYRTTIDYLHSKFSTSLPGLDNSRYI